MYHLRFHEEWVGVPFVSYDEEEEYKYRKKMIKAFKHVLKYYGVELEAKQC